MAYTTHATVTDIDDLVTKLFAFATGLSTTPWTQDELKPGGNRYGTLHRGSCYVSFRWDATPSTDLAIYQSLGWSGSTEPHNQTDDSGNGDTTEPINAGRRCNFLTSGSYPNVYFFADEGANPSIYVAVEISSGVFRHFGFGHIQKHGTWTGGEFAYGHFWDQGASNIDNPSSAAHSFLLDNAYSGTDLGATMHAEGLASQGASEKWVQFGNRTPPAGTDRAGEDRQVFIGGSRGGLWASYLAWMRYSTPNAFKPLCTIPVIERDLGSAPDIWKWRGEMVGVAICNVHGFTDGQEIVVGSDTWKIFPWVRKRYLQDNAEESWNAGIAYKK